MRCASCGFENPEGLKFCNECGTALKRRCIQCGFENAPQAKFCGECGMSLTGQSSASRLPSQAPRPEPLLRYTPKHLSERILAEQAALEARGALEEERKTITALFADIKGSMALMKDLDPEEARALVDPALQLMLDAAHS